MVIGCVSPVYSPLLAISVRLDKLSFMAKKTKAEKIAAALRAKRNVVAPSVSTHTGGVHIMQPAITSHIGSAHHTEAAQVYVSGDLRKTMVVTLCIISLLTLVYVLQYKGYY